VLIWACGFHRIDAHDARHRGELTEGEDEARLKGVGGSDGESPVRSPRRWEGRQREPRTPAACPRPCESLGQLLVDGVAARRRNDGGALG
jgi:hypothetical protein